MSRTILVPGCLLWCALISSDALAGQGHAAALPSPVEPAVISRDASGRNVTIRASRATSSIKIDGRLDELVYSTVPPVSDFVQVEPHEGEPATQKTEVWILFDDKNLYVAFRCYESNPEKMVVNELRRDNTVLAQNEYVSWGIDTFYDRRNGTTFTVTPIGGRMDGQLTNERQYNGDYNPIWDAKTSRFEGGWIAEAAIPFKSLRYGRGRQQTWGMTIFRSNRWKNEIQSINRMPQARGSSALFQFSQAPTIVGIEVPPRASGLEIKPYINANLTTDLTAQPRVRNDPNADAGLDVKYGITAGLTADLTYNTDFAQVEADEQQVNLTRFSLFFPEKREFFLENRDVFAFAGTQAAGAQAAAGDVPLLFYSRRIGLNGARVVPIQGGGRLTGRVGRFTVGLLDIRVEDDPATGLRPTNFSIVRVKRDLLRRSSIGVLFGDRSIAQAAGGRNQTYGVDGTFAFFSNLAINTYWARTSTTGPSPSLGTGRDTASYRAQLDYAGDRYGVQAEHLSIGRDFNPEIGFVRRVDIHKNQGLVRFSPRPRRFPSIRKFTYQGSVARLENGAGRRELQDAGAEFAIEWQSSDKLTVDYDDLYEYLPAAFHIAPAVTLPVGGYDYNNLKVTFATGQQRPVNASFAVEHGAFYSGHKTGFTATRGRMKIMPQLSLEPTYAINRVTLPQGDFTTHLLGSRITLTPSPLMFISALLQYNSSTSTMASNVRLRWEYQPGSELFVVYNEQRDTLPTGFPTLANRAFVVKINRLFRF